MALALVKSRPAEDMIVPVLVRQNREERLKSEVVRLQAKLRSLRTAASVPVAQEMITQAEAQLSSKLRRLALYRSPVQ